MLSGNEIYRQMKKGNIVIEPFDYKNLNPNSYNITLNPKLLVYDCEVLDMKKPNPTKEIIIPEEGYMLETNKIYLGSTNEYTETHNYVACIDGRSSIGRLGLFIHVTAGFGDVGFKGNWTLEIKATQPIIIYPNIPIGQLYYEKVQGKITEYSGRYMGQRSARESRLYQDYVKQQPKDQGPEM